MSARRKKKNKGYYRLPVFITSLIVCLFGALSLVFSSIFTKPSPANEAPSTITEEPAPIAPQVFDEKPAEEVAIECHYELPQILDNRSQQIIEHLAYTVSYNHDWFIPNWVAYELTNHEVFGEQQRSNHFAPDPLVQGDPVVPHYYSNSGYDRGHMAPAGDMKWSEQAMRESFYMTNICPQNHNNNAGDWKDLEELGRDLAQRYKSIYICCGPIVTDASNTIGARHIVVPQSFYKVFLRCKSDGSWTSIGFVMPNAPGNRPLMTYMLPVDKVEQLTGIDFFYNLPDSIEEIIEADYTISDWTIR